MYAATLVVASVVSRVVRRVRDVLNERVKRRQQYRIMMAAAGSYTEWKALAEQLYNIEDMDEVEHAHHQACEAKLYDKKLLSDKMHHLQKINRSGNVKELMLALRIDLVRNVANIAKRCAARAFIGWVCHLCRCVCLCLGVCPSVWC